jgi:AcrR family transcriptional regulator
MAKIQRQEHQHQRYTDKAEQILQGALPEFLKHGYARTSMDRVANSAGVSKQTLYSYYKDKNGLFTALIERIASNKFQLLWSKPLEGEAKKVLRDLAYRLLESVKDEEYLDFVRLIIAESGTRPELSQLYLNSVTKPANKMLTRYFQNCLELNFSDPEATARIFIDSLMFLIMSQEVMHGKEIMPMESDRYVNNLINLILNNEKK